MKLYKTKSDSSPLLFHSLAEKLLNIKIQKRHLLRGKVEQYYAENSDRNGISVIRILKVYQ